MTVSKHYSRGDHEGLMIELIVKELFEQYRLNLNNLNKRSHRYLDNCFSLSSLWLEYVIFENESISFATYLKLLLVKVVQGVFHYLEVI